MKQESIEALFSQDEQKAKIDRASAIAHITKQMMEKQEPYIIAIEEYLTNICNDKIAEKLMAEGKTLIGAFEFMRDKAKEIAENGCACLTDEEGFRIVEEYYGISEDDKEGKRNNTTVIDIMEFM